VCRGLRIGLVETAFVWDRGPRWPKMEAFFCTGKEHDICVRGRRMRRMGPEPVHSGEPGSHLRLRTPAKKPRPHRPRSLRNEPCHANPLANREYNLKTCRRLGAFALDSGTAMHVRPSVKFNSIDPDLHRRTRSRS